MHEVSIAQNIIDIARSTLNGHDYHRVIGIRLRIGPLSGVDPDALAFAMSAVSPGTVLESAIVHIERTLIRGRCPQCQETFESPDMIYACPHCEAYGLHFLSGDELEILDLEVD